MINTSVAKKDEDRKRTELCKNMVQNKGKSTKLEEIQQK